MPGWRRIQNQSKVFHKNADLIPELRIKKLERALFFKETVVTFLVSVFVSTLSITAIAFDR
jgi:hypothetical protein